MAESHNNIKFNEAILKYFLDQFIYLNIYPLQVIVHILLSI
jgi:hypothetical protein